MTKRFVAMLVMLGGVVNQPAFGQQSVLVGSVTSDTAGKRPIANASVSISAGTPAPQVRADSAGAFRINGLNRGHYVLIVRAIGFASVYDTITIDHDDVTHRNVVLAYRVEQLAPVVTKAVKVDYISPALRGFEDRRAAGFGHFIPEATLRALDNERLSDIMLARIPGLKLLRSRTGSLVVGTRQACPLLPGKALCPPNQSPCFATVYMDGVMLFDLQATSRLQSAGGQPPPPPSMDDINVNELAGVEFYAGEATAPPGYRQSGCGLLMLWTREK